MKTLLILVAAFAVFAAGAQTTPTDQSLQSMGAPGSRGTRALAREPKPNEIIKGNVAYSGIAVQLVKAGNPLQLFNPAAPPQYGSAEDNTLRNPITGRAFGLKIFSLRF
jgi:hypothetical protein